MENSFPLHICNYNSHKLYVTVNRAHLLFHSIAIAFLVYYRASFLFQHPQLRPTPIVPWLLVFVSELLLSFMWLLGQGCRWRPVSRTVFPERLPEDSKLPGIDVFICTADPDKEPTVDVMNTVLSAMALDYPAEKLHVYLSDDGGAAITLDGMREAWKFARWWLPFCRRYGIKTRCPNAYFSGGEDEYYNLSKSSQFMADREKIQEEYEKLKKHIMRAKQNCFVGETSSCNARNHSPIIEVINKTAQEDDAKLPLLVYVSREKRPSRPHHFKAGALNLRVSGVISNSPYILVLDCDMYCNDPTSAKQAMCFHLDPIISSSLAFVQFPQLFRNITSTHIYDDILRLVFKLLWHGMDGLKGPIISGTNFYIKRESLFSSNIHQEETKVLASCTYEDDSKWGDEVGFTYNSVVEDFSTSLKLHCGGWKSVYLNPSRPQFLGTSPTNLNDVLIQNRRWNTGLLGIGISRFCPLIYGPSRMSFLQSVCYAQFAFLPLYCLPLCCFGIIPQLCLLGGISLYPEVSSSFFLVFAFIFTSAMVKHLYDVIFTGGSIQVMINEQRIWMMKSVTCHVYGSLDAIMKILGLREDSFLPTNKVEHDDQVLLYQRGKFYFQTSTRLLAPIVTIIILNLASFFVGIIRIIVADRFEQLFVQVFLSFHILAMNYPIIEGMLIRKDSGCIPPSVTLISVIFAMILWALGSPILMYS
uniref:Glycosyltransferase 2-like domain-containing protein n=1 Tax=Manihot esculenta TaxID=3983 RepID=A0A2C9W8C2_MANES